MEICEKEVSPANVWLCGNLQISLWTPAYRPEDVILPLLNLSWLLSRVNRANTACLTVVFKHAALKSMLAGRKPRSDTFPSMGKDFLTVNTWTAQQRFMLDLNWHFKISSQKAQDYATCQHILQSCKNTLNLWVLEFTVLGHKIWDHTKHLLQMFMITTLTASTNKL